MAVLPNQACCNLIVNKMFKHSIKFYKQKDAMQCGVASLAMICSHYGKFYTIEQIATKCFVNTDGVSLKGIGDAAKSFGLNTYPIKAGIEVLLENVSPCILHWNQNHFVVLYKTNKRGTKF